MTDQEPTAQDYAHIGQMLGLTEDERHIYEAVEKYRNTFGDESFPGIDFLPEEYRDELKLSDLLLQCVATGMPLEQAVSVEPLRPDTIPY